MSNAKRKMKSQSFEAASRGHWLDIGVMLGLMVALTFSLLSMVQNNLQESVWLSAPITALGNQAISNALVINGSLQEDKLLSIGMSPPSLESTQVKTPSKNKFQR